MKFAEIDLAETLHAIGAVLTAIGIILTGFWSYRAKRAAEAGQITSRSNQITVRDTQDEVKAIHTLVNGQHGELLRQNAMSAMRIAALTRKPEDIQAAHE